MAKNDSRIKIVNNNKNRGLLYSRAMGIINSKGEYIMNLDPDDELEGPDNLEYLYKKANILQVDMISFGFIRKNMLKTDKFTLCSNFNKIYLQPEIFDYGNKNNDYLIWNKLVKKEIFIKAYLLFKKQIYKEKWNYGEDEIWSSLIYKHSNSMICVEKTIYIYYINNNSLMRNKYNIIYTKNIINWLEMFTKIFNNKNEKKYLINRLNYLMNILLNNNNFLSKIKNNTEIKNKYINTFKNIIIQYKYNNTVLKSIIDSLE